VGRTVRGEDEMNIKQTAVYTLIVLALAVAFTKYFYPTIKTKIEEKEVVKTDIRTVIKEITKPDGTIEKTTEIVDKSKETSKKEFEQTVSEKPNWLVLAGAHASLKSLSEPVYSLQVNRRILGPMFVGASVRTDKELGLHIGLEF
jgi:hypothetical protein